MPQQLTGRMAPATQSLVYALVASLCAVLLLLGLSIDQGMRISVAPVGPGLEDPGGHSSPSQEDNTLSQEKASINRGWRAPSQSTTPGFASGSSDGAHTGSATANTSSTSVPIPGPLTPSPAAEEGTSSSPVDGSPAPAARPCAAPRKASSCRLKASSWIHVAIVSASWQRESAIESETRALVMSILAQTRCNLWLHFLVLEGPELVRLPHMMDAVGAQQMVPLEWPGSPAPPVRGPLDGYVNASMPEAVVLYSLHVIPTAWLALQLKPLGLYPPKHHSGLPGMSKFFNAEILWQVPQVLYLDTDMLVGGDIQDLWGHLSAMRISPELLMWIGNNKPHRFKLKASRQPFCAGIMVQDLDRMRQTNLTKLLVEAVGKLPVTSHEEYVETGDQWLYTIICLKFPELCKVLGPLWNLSGCFYPQPFLGLSSTAATGSGSCWRIAHFNCGRRKDPKYLKGILGWNDLVSWATSLQPEDLHPT